MLETAAERARKRGAESTAVAAFERAARLSASEAARGNYLIRATDIAISLGWTNVVLRLLGEAEPLELEPIDRTRLLFYLEQFEPRWTGATKVPALVEMATALSHDGDDLRAVQVLHDVAYRCWWGNPPPETRSLVVNAATSLELPPSTPSLLFVLGLADPVGQGAEVVERLSLLQSEPDREPWESLELGVAGTAVWADDIAVHFLDAAASGARAQGRLGLLAQTLVSHAWAALDSGNGTRRQPAPPRPQSSPAKRLKFAGSSSHDWRRQRLPPRGETRTAPTGSSPSANSPCLPTGRIRCWRSFSAFAVARFWRQDDTKTRTRSSDGSSIRASRRTSRSRASGVCGPGRGSKPRRSRGRGSRSRATTRGRRSPLRRRRCSTPACASPAPCSPNRKRSKANSKRR